MPMNGPAETLPSPAADWAWFIDFDGTLVDIATTPGLTVIPSDLPATLARLRDRVGGALAIVTGRPAQQIHDLLAPFRPTVSGLHGWELIDADGIYHRPPAPLAGISEIREAFQAFAHDHTGIMVEDKGIAVALHYRQAPDLEPQVRAFIARLFKVPGKLAVIDGKKVFEIRPKGRDKGSAVRKLMECAPFSGRIPLYAGDDSTDEDAFAAVNALAGTTILVGRREHTAASLRLSCPADFRTYLSQAAY